MLPFVWQNEKDIDLLLHKETIEEYLQVVEGSGRIGGWHGSDNETSQCMVFIILFWFLNLENVLPIWK